MNDQPLMDAVVDMVLFLELKDDQTVDEDAALEMLEQIAATLQKLDASTKRRFLEHLKSRAKQAHSDVERQSIESLASNLGLAPQ